MASVLLAIVGALLICGGSFFAIVAPGDGQTGMFTFPLWIFGAIAGISALVRARATGTMPIVGALALLAVVSVGCSFYASATYKPPISSSR